MVYIYALKCPELGDIRYIGKAKNPTQRLKFHFYDSVRKKTPVNCWIKSLAARGLKPSMEVVKETDEQNWATEEKYHISLLRSMNKDRMLNLADGGNQPSQSLEQRQKNGRKNAKNIHSDPYQRHIWELKKNMGDTLKWLRKNSRWETYNRVVAGLKRSAVKRPDLFGEYARL